MANIFSRLGSSILDRGIGGTIGHGFGVLGMGALKGTGKLAMGSAELGGKAAMGFTEGIGSSLMNQFAKNPGAVIGAATFGAVAGGIIADQDGQADPSRTSLKGGVLGLGVATLGGGSAMTGLGVAVGGAAVAGGAAFGQVGRMMMSPITKGEKAASLLKSNPKMTTAELAKVGAEVGSKEAVEIGLGNLGDFKLNKGFAVPAIVGASIIKGVGEGVQTFEKSRMGMNDGMMRSATPQLPNPLQAAPSNPSYANNAGATGDLVFAMHRNR